MKFRIEYMPGGHDCHPNGSEELEFYPVGTQVICNQCGVEWRLNKREDGYVLWERPLLGPRFMRLF